MNLSKSSQASGVQPMSRKLVRSSDATSQGRLGITTESKLEKPGFRCHALFKLSIVPYFALSQAVKALTIGLRVVDESVGSDKGLVIRAVGYNGVRVI